MFDLTRAGLLAAWHSVDAISFRRSGILTPDLPDKELDTVREQMRDCLKASGGEVSARVKAAKLGQSYLDLNEEGRRRFLTLLATEFDVDHELVVHLASDYTSNTDKGNQSEDNKTHSRHNLRHELRDALRPQYIKLLMQFNSLPSGVKFLVDLRADLLNVKESNTSLATLDKELQHLLKAWFDIGFLDLKRITWDARASLLEKLMLNEAVHKVRSWDDMKHRLSTDRRCYAFFHPGMPDEPLIFVQVALADKIAKNIDLVLAEDTPAFSVKDAKTAIFYSISNCQPGLKGVNLGDFLIKRVVNDLTTELPDLKKFATLSPVPSFLKYIHDNEEEVATLITKRELALIQEAYEVESLSRIIGSPYWEIDLGRTEAMRTALIRCCAHYLLNAKRNNRALDSVANFHLSNGARLENINWLADSSERGLKQSAGIMVNYRYNPKEIEKNHEAYIATGETAASSSVKALLKK